MRNCELCEKLAAIYCDSDHASLCWDCDLKVHTANFLVAKHSRTLLCHVCQSPTAWSAAGGRIGRTVSVCEKCVNDEEDEEAEEIDLEDIQVVPLSSTTAAPPPAVESSSSNCGNFSLKRMRENDGDSGTSTSNGEVDSPPVAAEEEHGGHKFVASFSKSLTGRVETNGCSATMELIGRINRHSS